jgi:hypothetical protein
VSSISIEFIADGRVPFLQEGSGGNGGKGRKGMPGATIQPPTVSARGDPNCCTTGNGIPYETGKRELNFLCGRPTTTPTGNFKWKTFWCGRSSTVEEALDTRAGSIGDENPGGTSS